MALTMRSSFLGGARATSGARRVAPKAVSNGSRVTMSARPLWLPGSTPPAHLDGSLPGDFGFDPLGLGANPEQLKWFKESELIHGRWAMAAVAGILVQVRGASPRGAAWG